MYEVKPKRKGNRGYQPKRLGEKTKYVGKHTEMERKRKVTFAIPVSVDFSNKLRRNTTSMSLIAMSILLIIFTAIFSSSFVENEDDVVDLNTVSYDLINIYKEDVIPTPPFSYIDLDEHIHAESHQEKSIVYYSSPSEEYEEEIQDIDIEIFEEVEEEEVIDVENIEVPIEPTESAPIEPAIDPSLYEPNESSITPLAAQLTGDEELEYLGNYRITGYDPLCEHCCGKSNGITASGNPAEYYSTVAMNGGIPFGTKVYVVGYGVFTVEDRGGSKVGVDIACPGHNACYKVTNANGVDVYIVK